MTSIPIIDLFTIIFVYIDFGKNINHGNCRRWRDVAGPHFVGCGQVEPALDFRPDNVYPNLDGFLGLNAGHGRAYEPVQRARHNFTVQQPWV